MTGTVATKWRGVAFLQHGVAFAVFGGSRLAFSQPRCRGANGRSGGCSVVWRPCTLAGHSPLPSAPTHGDRGASPLPCTPSPRWHRGRHVVGIAGAAGAGGHRYGGSTSLRLPAADVSSASQGIAGRGAVALAAGTPYRYRRRRLTGPPHRRLSPCAGRFRARLTVGPVGISASPVVSPRRSPLRGTGCRGSLRSRRGRAADMSSASPWFPVGVAAVAGKELSRHHRGNVLRGQAHRGCRVTKSVPHFFVSRCGCRC